MNKVEICRLMHGVGRGIHGLVCDQIIGIQRLVRNHFTKHHEGKRQSLFYHRQMKTYLISIHFQKCSYILQYLRNIY